jgi:cytochrome c1
MRIRIAPVWLVAFSIVASSAWSQDAADDVKEGHRVALLVCYACHVVERDQRQHLPTLEPPAPSFETIAQRGNVNAESLQAFLTTTHRDVSNPGAMPSPGLTDSYVKQVAAYILSLRRPQQ